jgi:DNA-binding transcriptional ArsR family regulator
LRLRADSGNRYRAVEPVAASGGAKKQGIIDSRKEGTKVFYRILHHSALEVIKAVEKTIGEQLSESRNLLSQLGERGGSE